MDGILVMGKEIWLSLTVEEARQISDYLQETFNLTEIGGKGRIEAARLRDLINSKT